MSYIYNEHIYEKDAQSFYVKYLRVTQMRGAAQTNETDEAVRANQDEDDEIYDDDHLMWRVCNRNSQLVGWQKKTRQP